MKKLIICAAVLAAGLMTSCNKDTNRCWEVTTISTVEVLGFTRTDTVVTHHWMSENELEAEIVRIKESIVGDNVTVSYKRTSKAQEECHD